MVHMRSKLYLVMTFNEFYKQETTLFIPSRKWPNTFVLNLQPNYSTSSMFNIENICSYYDPFELPLRVISVSSKNSHSYRTHQRFWIHWSNHPIVDSTWIDDVDF